MNRLFRGALVWFWVAAACVLCGAAPTLAQCDTCATPVAYQPVAQTVSYQPYVAYRPYTGWYPGKLLDQWRLRRWTGSTAAAPVAATTYSAGYTPYTAAYAPTSTSGYHTTNYVPYVTSYAPLRRTVSYQPIATTVYRPVAMQPVVSVPACTTCGYQSAYVDSSCSSCGGCGECSSCGVSSAVYSDAGSGCASCAGASSSPSYAAPAPSYQGSSQGTAGPATPQPYLPPSAAVPSQSQYRGGAGTEGSNGAADRTPEEASEPYPDPYPQPPSEQTTPGDDSSTYYPRPLEAPQLLSPSNDRTARGPSVDVWTAVYKKPVRSSSISTSDRVPASAREQAQRDAEGWFSVPRN
jgi:hypothetical protein